MLNILLAAVCGVPFAILDGTNTIAVTAVAGRCAAVSQGANGIELVVRVTNLWPNRLIGDAALPEKSRVTRTNLNTYKANDPLLPSGPIGPVTIRTEARGAGGASNMKARMSTISGE